MAILQILPGTWEEKRVLAILKVTKILSVTEASMIIFYLINH
jgi:hypothetical protein